MSFTWKSGGYHEKGLLGPCAPWCTTEVGGAQCMSKVHNIALYYIAVVHRIGPTNPDTWAQHTDPDTDTGKGRALTADG